MVRLTSSGGATVTESVYSDGASAVEPDNLLTWGPRGTADPALLERAAAGYAAAKQLPRSQVQYRLLFGGSNDPGQSYALLQAWVPGQPAQRFGWIESPGRDTAPGLDGVALVDREPDAQADRVVLYDGNGDLDRSIAEVSVVELLCGQTGCD